MPFFRKMFQALKIRSPKIFELFFCTYKNLLKFFVKSMNQAKVGERLGFLAHDFISHITICLLAQ